MSSCPGKEELGVHTSPHASEKGVTVPTTEDEVTVTSFKDSQPATVVELGHLKTGTYTCDSFDPVQLDGDLAKTRSTGWRFERLLVAGGISLFLLATVAGAFYTALNGDGGALRYHCSSCPVGTDTREMTPPVIGSVKPELAPSPPPELTGSEVPVDMANALSQLEQLPDVEAVTMPNRQDDEPPLVEVVFSIPYEAFASNEAEYRARFIAEVAAAADMSKEHVQIEYVRAGSLTVGFVFLSNDEPPQEQELEILSELHSPERGFGCLPSIIVNDFDAAVSATVSANLTVSESWIPGAPAEKPYFHDWFGDVTVKDFHHDDAQNKGQVHATYTVPLPTAGCWVLNEWHLGGNQYCHGYMSRRVPHTIGGCVGCSDGDDVLYVDQAVDGGRWNSIGSFEFEGAAPVATVSISNDDGGASDPAVQDVTDCTCELFHSRQITCLASF